MKANEFVKLCGINIAERDVAAWESGFIRRQDFTDHFGFDLLPELKHIVKSHSLVESHGGLETAKEYLSKKHILAWSALDGQLSQAVKDVESCK